MNSIVRKTSLSPRNTWIKLDANGHSSFLDIDKYELMRQVRIDARDLRILDPLLSYPSAIFGREDVIVLNLEFIFCNQHIKAIITAKEVFLQDPTGEDVVPVVRELQRRLFTIDTNQGDDQDHSPLDVEVDEDDGMLDHNSTFFIEEILIIIANIHF
ncbi:hypothetical protein MtrunA17_Chr1g0165871 [Medicago truncatula]|uniref:Uncharacterized protein n=1 Tax=Medicago truncatula TaxID=3880 RepID=A0A396JMP7_MEDTR|nr:hypothetical protein MtrunA17_Chr1g0165871 [Medicago truncatula]